MVKTELGTKLKTAASTQLIQYAGLLNMTNYELLDFVQKQLVENPVLESVPPTQSITESFAVRGMGGKSAREQNYDGDKDMLSLLGDKSSEETLYDHVHEQLLCSGHAEKQIALTEYLCRCLDANGYLEESCEEIAGGLSVAVEAVREARDILRSLTPAGIGARDLADCLMLQLERAENPPRYASEIIASHMQALAESKFKVIAKALGAKIDDVYTAAEFIKQLDPKPAARFGGGEKTNYIIPDAIVINTPNGLEVRINDRWMPGLRLSAYYSELLKSGDEEVKNYLRERFAKAKMTIHSIEQRRDTLALCVKEIVRIQERFFLGVQSCPQPLLQTELAETLSLNESTLSRAINGKYLLCSSGMYPLSYFFSRSSFSDGAETRSQSYVMDRIAAIIAGEDTKKPLSDQSISELMQKEGIDIARRTVAKYRTELNIPSASERKARFLSQNTNR